MNKDIFLTNSLGNKKHKFIPIDPKKIGMYVCGPTVYDNPHIGNARPLVVFDILFKILKCKYGKNSVSYVRNITDIDDKIISSSVEKNITIDDLTKNITNIFFILKEPPQLFLLVNPLFSQNRILHKMILSSTLQVLQLSHLDPI